MVETLQRHKRQSHKDRLAQTDLDKTAVQEGHKPAKHIAAITVSMFRYTQSVFLHWSCLLTHACTASDKRHACENTCDNGCRTFPPLLGTIFWVVTQPITVQCKKHHTLASLSCTASQAVEREAKVAATSCGSLRQEAHTACLVCRSHTRQSDVTKYWEIVPCI